MTDATIKNRPKGDAPQDTPPVTTGQSEPEVADERYVAPPADGVDVAPSDPGYYMGEYASADSVRTTEDSSPRS